MNITPEEAQAALNDIQQASTKARSFLHISAYYALLWGAVWTSGFLATQLRPQLINWIWIVMIIIGIVGSAIFGSTQGTRMRAAPGSREAFIGSRLAMFYGMLYGFAILWLILFPLSYLQIGMFWITVTMFGYIISGIWFQQSLFIAFGVGITLMSVLGYYLLPHYFWLWAAVFAGLPLIGMGLYFLRHK
ncbi:MAG: hypothetical protein M3Z08_21940 [Chloroflexota bacterium]|nr:hypothetical protein [Chloroflexota bacterium]